MMSLDASSCSLASKMRPLAYDADGNLAMVCQNGFGH